MDKNRAELKRRIFQDPSDSEVLRDFLALELRQDNLDLDRVPLICAAQLGDPVCASLFPAVVKDHRSYHDILIYIGDPRFLCLFCIWCVEKIEPRWVDHHPGHEQPWRIQSIIDQCRNYLCAYMKIRHDADNKELIDTAFIYGGWSIEDGNDIGRIARATAILCIICITSAPYFLIFKHIPKTSVWDKVYWDLSDFMKHVSSILGKDPNLILADYLVYLVINDKTERFFVDHF